MTRQREPTLTPLATLTLLLVFAMTSQVTSAQYSPTWKSLDARPLPSWYDEAKVGIFLHWGVYSVPSFGDEWFWTRWKDPFDPQHAKFAEFMKKNYRPGFTYQDFAAQFTTELFDPDHWADLLQKSGARYVVLTSKHHEGYTLWPSAVSWNWNSMDVGPKRDLVGDLASAVRNRTDLRFGVYHSLYEWYNPLYKNDRYYNRSDFVTMKTMPELKELVERYHPEVIWSDGDWTGMPEYWRSQEFLAWLYNDSPVKESVVTNDRWGSGTNCKHGGYYTCHDGYNPGTLQDHKFENCFTLDGAWGYRRDSPLASYKSIENTLYQVISTVSCGGNVLINVGPTKDGIIMPIFEERLTQLGEWLGLNGEAIYSSKPWTVQHDPTNSDVWYTQRGGYVYGISLKWPTDGFITMGSAPNVTECRLLGYDGVLEVENGRVMLPPLQKVKSQWAWVFKFEP
ncbi:alpha-L-fucosidase-like [Amphibalanus amphitrite]|uniref:alpha-L-fucosidase-like n=1 Tax=Amphibalanus amphitrite TaxID=1232801 RepID=UPI001C924EE2|nr:alpha-L-fucosidase-like [Amphibalanus amphitrite]